VITQIIDIILSLVILYMLSTESKIYRELQRRIELIESILKEIQLQGGTNDTRIQSMAENPKVAE
jgi:hypothetical protein